MVLLLFFVAASATPEGYAVFRVGDSSSELGAEQHRIETRLHAAQPGVFRSVHALGLPRMAESAEGSALETAKALVRAAETAFFADDYDTAEQHLDGAQASAEQVPEAGFDVWLKIGLWRVAIGLARGDEARATEAARRVLSARPDGVLPAESFWPSLVEFVEVQRERIPTATLELECPVPGATIVVDRLPFDAARRVGLGRHTFVVSAPGFQTLVGNLSVEADTQHFVYLLPRLPPEVRAEAIALAQEPGERASPILERFCGGLVLRGCIFLLSTAGAKPAPLGLWLDDDGYTYWSGSAGEPAEQIARWTATMQERAERGPDLAFELAFAVSSEAGFTSEEADTTRARFQGTGARVAGAFGMTRPESSVTGELAIDYARYAESQYSAGPIESTVGAESSARVLVEGSAGYRFVFANGAVAVMPRAVGRFRRYSLNRPRELDAVLSSVAQQLVVSQTWTSLALGVLVEGRWRGFLSGVALDFDVLALTPSAPNALIRDLQPAQAHPRLRVGYQVLDELLIFMDYGARFALEQPLRGAQLTVEEGGLTLGARYAFW